MIRSARLAGAIVLLIPIVMISNISTLMLTNRGEATQFGALAGAVDAVKPEHPKLESALSDLVREQANPSLDQSKAAEWATGRGFQISGQEVRVIVETRPNGINQAAGKISALGVKEETRNGRLLQVKAPVVSLPQIADIPEVSFVRRPLTSHVVPVSHQANALVGDPAVPLQAGAVTSEGVHVIGADAWQAAGMRGRGATVAIIDLGFADYQAELGNELPATVIARSFRSDGDIGGGGEVHGTACAEIVHDVAPDARLLLLNYGTEVEWGDAVDFAISQGVNVASSSVGFFDGPLDGTGFMADKLAAARAAGILWAQASGNEAQRHWEGNFVDADGNGLLEFAPGVELNTFSVPPGAVIIADLSWNDWPASAQDYDLFLLQVTDNGPVVVDASTNVQSGTQPPFESIFFPTMTGGLFGLAIQKASATRDARFQLFVPDFDLQFQVPQTSLALPADAAAAMAVGANFFANDQLEPFSSQGPTVDGRTKPDVVAPDGVSTATYGPQAFQGTSASAPHAAGAAALVKAANPTFSPDQVEGFLEGRALDLGPPGKDNQFGAGRLNLGPPGGAPQPAGAGADAKIEIVFPHDAVGQTTDVAGGTLANLGTFLFLTNTLAPVACSFSNRVHLFRAMNTNVAQEVASATPGVTNSGGQRIVAVSFNDVDVAAATNPSNKYYFFLSIDGVPTRSNVWSHGADARTIFPQPDVATGVGPLGTAVDAKIEIVFPHDIQGKPQPVVGADLANVAVDIFGHGSLVSAPPDAKLIVRLFRSLNNDPQQMVGVGQKQQVVTGGISHPRWLFNDVDVSASKNPLNKYYFRVEVDAHVTSSNIWSHGADARTIFPTQDTPSASCQ